MQAAERHHHVHTRWQLEGSSDAPQGPTPRDKGYRATSSRSKTKIHPPVTKSCYLEIANRLTSAWLGYPASMVPQLALPPPLLVGRLVRVPSLTELSLPKSSLLCPLPPVQTFSCAVLGRYPYGWKVLDRSLSSPLGPFSKAYRQAIIWPIF